MDDTVDDWTIERQNGEVSSFSCVAYLVFPGLVWMEWGWGWGGNVKSKFGYCCYLAEFTSGDF